MKKLKWFIISTLLFSPFFILNTSINAKSHNEYFGYLKNDAQIHQKANDESKIIEIAHTSIMNGKIDNGSKSNNKVPEVADQKKNGMYRIKYNQKIGYVDRDNYTVGHNFYDKQDFTHYTRKNLSDMAKSTKNPNYQIPSFKSMKISDIKSAQGSNEQKAYDRKGNLIVNKHTLRPGKRTSTQLDVWDSWPLQHKDGTLANYHGYHVVLALAGNYNQFKKGQEGITYAPEARIYVFYQKIGTQNTGTSSWKNAGPAFVSNMDGASKNDQYLKHQTQEWSGSAYLDDDNSVRLFYTDFSGDPRINGTGNNNQVLSTAKLFLNTDNNGLSVDRSKTTDHRSLFSGDGVYYQNENQFYKSWPDNWPYIDMSIRDPHLIVDHGQQYLAFEGNTGEGDGYEGINNLFNMYYFGGNKKFQHNQQKQLFADKPRYLLYAKNAQLKNNVQKYQKEVQHYQHQLNNHPHSSNIKKQYNIAQTNLMNNQDQLTYNDNAINIKSEYANAALGLIKLNPDYTVNSVLKPMIGFNTTDDETERPDMFEHKGKWYLFTDTRATRISSYDINPKGIYMLGFVANKPTGPFKPLNGNGLVLSSNDLNPHSRTFNYSYYIIKSKDPNNDNFLVTDYMTNTGNPKANGGYSTFGPSFRIQIKGDQTKVIKNSTLPQGTIDPDAK